MMGYVCPGCGRWVDASGHLCPAGEYYGELQAGDETYVDKKQPYRVSAVKKVATDLLVVKKTVFYELLAVCRHLCNSIRVMGELKCYNDLGQPADEESATYIKEHWLEHVAECQADAYKAGMAILDKFQE